MPVTVQPRGDVALVVIDNPPVNATSRAVRAGLMDAVARVDGDPALRAAILMGRGRTFVAGGDVTEFDRAPEPPHLPEVVAGIEAAAKPWLAAMHGAALGGGLELALGCRWRVAARGTRLGLPEVTLGLIPGAGGTVRLPRLVALDMAARMASLGAPVSADAARDAGLLDAVLDGDLEAGAIAFLDAALAGPLPLRTLDRPAPADPGTAAWQGHRVASEKKHRGQAAPALALESMHAAVNGPADAALAAERQTHLRLRGTVESRALRHVFFAERAALKAPVDAEPGPLDAAGVVGGGTMGAGIAVAFLDAGIPVTLLERDQAALDRGLSVVAGTLDASVKRGRLTAADRAARWANLTGTLAAADLGSADVVVEAVFEDLAVKRAVFERLDAACKPGAVLATNTSYIDPNAIAAATRRPDAVVGLHFFSPAQVMKLLEVVRTDGTSDGTLATAWALARRLGKTPVLSGVCDGFIGNRILKVFRQAAERLLLQGAGPADVDGAMRAFGMPMGPFEMQDLAGLDIAAAMRAANRARGQAVFAPVADRLVAAERLGQKAGGGWYDYAAGDRTPRPSDAVAEIIDEEAAKAGTARTPLDRAAIQRLVLGPMVEEGRQILAEGIAATPDAIDLVEVHGFGFPRWRGGLMFWGETAGPGR